MAVIPKPQTMIMLLAFFIGPHTFADDKALTSADTSAAETHTQKKNFITVSSTDPSGVATVAAKVGSQSFDGTRSVGSVWTISVTGLAANTVNTVTVTATDSAPNANTTSLDFYIKYDSTIVDDTPPAIYFTNPTIDIRSALIHLSSWPSARIQVESHFRGCVTAHRLP